MRTLLRLLLGGLVGYLVIALLTTLVLEVLLSGRPVLSSGALVLIAASLGNFLAGITGGGVAGLFDRTRPIRVAMATCVFLAIDTTTITINQVGTEPGWFKVMSGVALMVAAVLGGWLLRRSFPKQRDRPQPS